MAKILIVDDEESVRDALAASLAQAGYQILQADRGETVQALVLSENPDLILLDVMLPGISGLDVCRDLRKRGIEIPVIMLTVKSSETDCIVGLEIGADDYITKPFSVRELLTRIGVQLRHTATRPAGTLAHYRFGDIEIDFDHLEAQRGGAPMALTSKEYDILQLLIRFRGKLVTRAQLLKNVWNYSAAQSTRTVDTHILNLRQKIEKDPACPKHIITIYGEGYKFIGRVTVTIRKDSRAMPADSILSVDVEDYFHVEAFAGVVSRDEWGGFPSRVEANTSRILDLFDETGVKGTFFVLGWVAERFPGLVREISARGHEIASHSYWHRLIYSLTPEEFRADTILARDCIEQVVGQAVQGYRAPSFSIVSKSAWALDILAETGIRYDSSVFPVKHDTYGVPDAPRAPFQVMTGFGPIVEAPMTTFRIGNSPNFPLGGGGYLRMLPGWYTRYGLKQVAKEGLPVICYIHPWELDPEQPRIQAGLKSRFRHYTNLAKTAGRLRELIGARHFTSFRDSGLVDARGLQTVKL